MDLRERSRWLDAGAGDAWFATELQAHLHDDAVVTCWEINYSPDDVGELDTAGGRIVLAADRRTAPFSRIMLLDIIENFPDDTGFLVGIVDDLLEPDGVVLVSAPAYQPLFSAHDTATKVTPSRGSRVVRGHRIIRRRGRAWNSVR